MRRLLVLLLPVSWVACFSSTNSGSGGDAGFPDGGGDFDSMTADVAPADDASAEATGPVEASTEASADVTAPPLDAAVDAVVEASLDAGPAPVTVVVGGVNGFEVGVPVVIGDATGAVVASLKTNAAGSVTTAVPAGGMVTVVAGSAATPALTTYLGVRPGDTLVVADHTGLPAYASAQVVSIPSMPALDAAASAYTLAAGSCSAQGGVPLYFSLNPGCVGLTPSGTSFIAAVPVVVEALGAVPFAYVYSKNTSFLTPPDDAGYLDFAFAGQSWSTQLVTQSLNVTGVPDGGALPNTTYAEVADGLLTRLQDRGGTFYTHPGFADSVQGEALFPGTGVSGVAAMTAAAPPTAPGALAVDASKVASEPVLTGVTATLSGAGGLSIGWTVAAGNLSGSTGVLGLTSWTSMTEAGVQSGTWTIVSPGTAAAQMAAPALPSALSAFAPLVSASLGTTTVFAVDGQTAFPSYDALLPSATLFAPQNSLCGVSTPVAPTVPRAGTAVVSFYADNPTTGC